MVLYDQSDFIQWGLRLLDGDPGYSPVYYGHTIQYDASDVYNAPYSYNAGQYDSECNHVENDEIIARTLQEEFSHLDIGESSGYSQEGNHFHASEPAYGWHNSSMTNQFSEGISRTAVYLFICEIYLSARNWQILSKPSLCRP